LEALHPERSTGLTGKLLWQLFGQQLDEVSYFIPHPPVVPQRLFFASGIGRQFGGIIKAVMDLLWSWPGRRGSSRRHDRRR
jgi:hypothetical protein